MDENKPPSYKIKKLHEKNPGQLFKWGFFKKEGHLVYRFAI
jgi:hypothetical protein